MWQSTFSNVVKKMESSRENNSYNNDYERRVIFKEDSWFMQWFSQFRNGSNPWMARYVYALMFLVANLLAWAARDYGRSALTEMERLKGCEGGRDCLGAEGVLRVSLGCFTFYITMFLTTVGTSKLNGRRNTWQSGWWSVKIVLWVVFTIIPFLLPSTIIQLYGQIAHFGAGVFLLIQLISVISFITWLNDCCQSDKNAERCQIHVMLLATAAYVVCIVGIIMMYIWYAPEPSCLLNIFFITWTLVLLQLMTSVSLHPKVNAGILAPGLMGLYVVFICWCAIRRHDFLSFRHFLFNVFDNLLGISTNKYAHAVDIFLHLGLLMKIGCPQTLRLVNKAFVVVVFVFVVVVLFFLLLYMFRAFCGDGEIV